MNILLAPVGSHGDVHPFCGIGRELLRRGHRVTMLTNGMFEPLARRVGLDFVPVGTADDFKRMIADPDLWHPSRGWKTVFRSTVEELMPIQYEALKAHVVPGETVIAAGTLALAARVLQDEIGVPVASVHLQPSVIWSAYETPRLPFGAWLRFVPAFVMNRLFTIVDVTMLDPFITPSLNAFRAEHGLAPVKRVRHWWNSPERIIGLFPEWFAPPQPDWPAQMKLTGFPLFDEAGIEPMPDDLLRFLETGDKPIAFTPGSAMSHGQDFFQAAVDACGMLKRRGLLLTRHAENIPPSLPPEVMHVPYAPFSELLPRCAAIVHHGGIGTTSQALAAGVPQLMQPMSHDQPDNAERVRRLGVGDWLNVYTFSAKRMARKLRALLESQEVAARCREIASRFTGARPLEHTCELIESLNPLAPRKLAPSPGIPGEGGEGVTG